MELDNPKLDVDELIADNKTLVMRMGQLSGWDLDEMFDLDEIRINLIDDNNWVDFDDPDNDFTRDMILEYISDFKNEIAEYAEDGEAKTQKELAEKIANEWEEILDDDLLKVVLVKSGVIGYDFDEGEVGKDDPIIEGGMTGRQLRWNALLQARNWGDWSDAVEYTARSDTSLFREAKKSKKPKYNIDDEDFFEPGPDEDGEIAVIEWKWQGKEYLVDPDRDHVWNMDQDYIGKRYKIEDDEMEGFMPFAMWEEQQD